MTDILFGKRGEPGKVVDVAPKQFTGLRDPFADSIRNLIDTRGGPSFEGPTTAAMTGAESDILSRITGGRTPLSDAANPTLESTIRGDFLSPDSNPFLRASIDSAIRPIVQNFEEQVMPRLRSDFTRAGQRVQEESSSPFDRAAAISSRGLADAVGDVSTRMSAANFESERARQQNAAQNAPAIEGQQLNNLVNRLQAAALPRMIEQLGVDRGLEEFNRRMEVFLQALKTAGTVSQPQTVTTPGTEGTQGLLAPALTAAATAFGGPAGGAFADALLSSPMLEPINRSTAIPARR